LNTYLLIYNVFLSSSKAVHHCVLPSVGIPRNKRMFCLWIHKSNPLGGVIELNECKSVLRGMRERQNQFWVFSIQLLLHQHFTCIFVKNHYLYLKN